MAKPVISYGWDGDSWQKLPMVWGYSDTWLERVLTTNAGTGTNTLDFTTVPDGEIWVATAIDLVNANNDPALQEFRIMRAGTDYTLARAMAPGADVHSSWQVHFILKKDDKLQARWTGCTAGDNLYAYVNGYKMKIAE